jgi:hypothetical protein
MAKSKHRKKKRTKSSIAGNPDQRYIKYLKNLIRTKYNENHMKFILEQQRSFDKISFDINEAYLSDIDSLGLQVGHCFKNARILSDNYSNISYTEGLCFDGSYILHGFCVDEYKNVIDPLVYVIHEFDFEEISKFNYGGFILPDGVYRNLKHYVQNCNYCIFEEETPAVFYNFMVSTYTNEKSEKGKLTTNQLNKIETSKNMFLSYTTAYDGWDGTVSDSDTEIEFNKYISTLT